MLTFKAKDFRRRRILFCSVAAMAAATAPHAFAADTTININTASSVVADAPAPGDTTTVNIAVRLGISNATSGSSQNYATEVVTGAGAGHVILNNDGRINGSIDFQSLTGRVTIDNDATSGYAPGWHSRGDSVLGEGADVVSTSGASGVYTAWSSSIRDYRTATIDFRSGDDVFNNGGFLVVGAGTSATGPNQFFVTPTATTLANLETFNNTGTIFLGARLNNSSAGPTAGTFEFGPTHADRRTDDALIMPGTDYVASGNARIVYDVDFTSGVTQSDCTARSADGVLPAADCFALPGGSTEGVTGVIVRSRWTEDRGAYIPDGIVLVDVDGGESAQGHFVIAPESDRYSPIVGAVDDGIFIYTIVYDEDDQKHRLYGLPGGAMQFGALANSVAQVWRTGNAGFFDRQADMRVSLGDEPEGGAWLRVTGDFAERDLIQTVMAAGTAFNLDHSHEQDTWALTGGVDLIRAGAGDGLLVLGVMLGYAHSKVTFEASPNSAELNGFLGGLYGSFVSGALFVDATATALGMTMDNNIPALGLTPDDSELSSDVRAYGLNLEGGWRVSLGSDAFVEPLAAVAYVTTDTGEVFAPSADRTRAGVTLEFEEATSLRAALGGRIGLETDYRGVLSQFSLLARVWNEFDGEAAGFVDNAGPDAPFGDEFSGTFTEVAGQVGLFGRAGISGYLKLGARLADDYQATTASAGFRYAW